MSSFTYLPNPPKMVGIELEDNELEEGVKLAAVKASEPVVGLRSFIGESKLMMCSGTIVECERNFSTGCFVITILTSASLVRHPDGSADVSPSLKIQVRLVDGTLCEGQIAATDFPYNLAIVKINYNKTLLAANLRAIDDPSLTLRDSGAFLRRHTQGVKFNLRHNDKVISLARNQISGELIVQSGTFSVGACPLDFEELRMTTCKTSEVFIGGPLINLHGEVIGLNFSYRSYAPFLPTNIVSRFLEHVKYGCDVRRPLHGMRVMSLDAANVALLENIFQEHPHVTGGVMVDQVKRGSPAEKAGICPRDLIIMCAGDVIKSSMEFSERMWDHSGESFEMGVIRSHGGGFRQLTMTIEDAIASPDSYR